MDDMNTDSYHSPELSSIVKDQNSQTNAGLAQSYTSGNAQARGLLNQPDNFNQGLSFGDRAQSDAIRGRYMAAYGHKEAELNNKMLQNADADHVRKLQQASDLASQEIELNRQKQILKWKKDQAARAARGAILGNVLGIAAGVGGAVALGPQGAMAGYQAGQGAGNLIGSAN